MSDQTESNESNIGEILTPKQEAFCVNYTQNDELFGNATLAYADAYGYDLDTMPNNDGVYLLSNGEEVSEEDYGCLEGKKTEGSKLIKESSRKRTYDMCSGLSSRLRRNVKIQARCRFLLNEFLRDDVVDARLIEIILKGDDKDSVAALKEYNALKQRITKKTDITTNGKELFSVDREYKNKVDELLSDYINPHEEAKKEEEESENSPQEVRNQEVHNGEVSTASPEIGAQG